MAIILNGTSGIITPGITNTGPFIFEGPVTVPAGSASSPSVSFTGSTNTGLYLSATGAVSISTAGTQRVVVNASGNVGIGTTTLTTGRLNVVGTGNANSIMTETAAYIGTSVNGLFIGSDSADTMMGVNNSGTKLTLLSRSGGVYSKTLTVDSGGNVGVGTDSPQTKFHVAGASTTEVRIVSSGDLTSGGAAFIRLGGSNSATSGYMGYGGTGSTYDIYNGLNGPLTFYTNAAERARITSNGQIITSYADGVYAQRGITTAGSNFDNPVVDLLTLPSSGPTNTSILIKVTCMQSVYATCAGNEHIGMARGMWTGSAWTLEQDTMTVVCGDLATVGSLSWSTRTLRYTANRSGNYDGYLITFEVLYNPTALAITFNF